MVTVGGTASLPFAPSLPASPCAAMPYPHFQQTNGRYRDMRCLAALAGSACEEIPEILHRIVAGRHLLPGLCGLSTLPSAIISFHWSKALFPSFPSFPSFPLRYLKSPQLPSGLSASLPFRPLLFLSKTHSRKPGITFRPFGHGDVNIGTGGHQQAYNYPVPLYKFKFTHLNFNCLISL